jgi:hypothetical protein
MMDDGLNKTASLFFSHFSIKNHIHASIFLAHTSTLHPMFDLFDDRDFAFSPSHMMLFRSNLFEDDKELQALHNEKNKVLTALDSLDSKIRDRHQFLVKEHQTNNPARYSRSYTSSHSNINGKEMTETKDVIEENKDGQKSIQQKADKVEKNDGKIVDEEHVDIQLSQDKKDKTKWKVTQNGKTVILDATDKSFGDKLNELVTNGSSSTSKPKPAEEAAEDDEEDAEDDEEAEETEDDANNQPLLPEPEAKPTQQPKKNTKKAPSAPHKQKPTKKKRGSQKRRRASHKSRRASSQKKQKQK